jgi:hypothetical protein
MPLGSPGQKLFQVRIVKDGFVQVEGFQSHERAGNVIEDLSESTANALIDGGYGVLVQDEQPAASDVKVATVAEVKEDHTPAVDPPAIEGEPKVAGKFDAVRKGGKK